MRKTGRNAQKKCRNGRGDRSYQAMESAYIGHSSRWTERASKQWEMRCSKHQQKGIWHGPRVGVGATDHERCRSADIGAVPGQGAQGGDMGRSM